MGILKDFANEVPGSSSSSKRSDCDVVVKDCVGLVGECNIVTKVEDCNTFVRSKEETIPAGDREVIARALNYIINLLEEINRKIGN